MNCEFCDRTFSNKGNMRMHQKTAKYCLQIQGVGPKIQHTCTYCSTQFVSKTRCSDHVNKCIEYYKSEIERLKSEYETNTEILTTRYETNIERLESRLTEMTAKNADATVIIHEKDTEIRILTEQLSASSDLVMKLVDKPTITMNNQKYINMPIFDLNSDSICSILENKFTYKDIKNGQKSVAKFIVENMLKDINGDLKYVCTDLARQKFVMKMEDDSLCRDAQAHKMLEMIGVPIRNKTRDIYRNVDEEIKQYIEEQYYEVMKMNDDNATFRNHLASLTSS